MIIKIKSSGKTLSNFECGGEEFRSGSPRIKVMGLKVSDVTISSSLSTSRSHMLQRSAE